MNVLAAAFNVAAMTLICLSMGYFLVAMAAGLFVLREEKTTLAEQGATDYALPFEDAPETFHLFFIIPCLNEEAVIAATVSALQGGKRSTILVIDDGSDDATATIAADAGDGVVVIRRELPNARQGKGEALNHAFAELNRLVSESGLDPANVLVCVMDADGRLSRGAIKHVTALFEDPTVGGAQLAVRIRNRNHNFLTQFQDYQFWSMSAITQFGRRKTGTVSLGGNGQFTRLTALRELGQRPWSASLTEDLDLAVSLLVNGWRLSTTPFASVDQQGVEGLKRLIIQRRRWYQGHMTSGKRLKDVWSAPTLSHLGALEVSAYLAVPWLFDLPWSILWHWTLFTFIVRAQSVFAFANSSLVATAAGVLVWYGVTFAPAIFTTIVYFRRDKSVGVGRALVMGHSFLVMNYLSFICAWGALIRMIQGQTGWDKTSRSSEPATSTSAPEGT